MGFGRVLQGQHSAFRARSVLSTSMAWSASTVPSSGCAASSSGCTARHVATVQLPPGCVRARVSVAVRVRVRVGVGIRVRGRLIRVK